MNVEWWGGSLRSPPAKYNLALRRSQAALLGWAYLPEGRALARSLFIRRARRPRSCAHDGVLSARWKSVRGFYLDPEIE